MKRAKVKGIDATYEVVGPDHRGAIWLSSEAENDDGYDGDMIVQKIEGEWRLMLADERCSVRYSKIELEVIE